MNTMNQNQTTRKDNPKSIKPSIEDGYIWFKPRMNAENARIETVLTFFLGACDSIERSRRRNRCQVMRHT